jgi:hypothetical protein
VQDSSRRGGAAISTCNPAGAKIGQWISLGYDSVDVARMWLTTQECPTDRAASHPTVNKASSYPKFSDQASPECSTAAVHRLGDHDT